MYSREYKDRWGLFLLKHEVVYIFPFYLVLFSGIVIEFLIGKSPCVHHFSKIKCENSK